MFKKILFLMIAFASARSFSMFGILPGQVSSTAGSGIAPRLAAISENPVSAAAAATAPDTKSKAEKKAKIAKPKVLKPLATRVVVRNTRIKPLCWAIDLYNGQTHIKGLPFTLLRDLNINNLLAGDSASFKDLQKEVAPWAVVDERSKIENQLKDQKAQG